MANVKQGKRESVLESWIALINPGNLVKQPPKKLPPKPPLPKKLPMKQKPLRQKCSRYGTVETVGTVVVVGVKLRRVQRVRRLQLRWVGRARRRGLCHVRSILRGAFLRLGIPCTSTHKTQTSPAAAAVESAYVHSLAHPVRTKINPVKPVVNHAPVGLSAILLEFLHALEDVQLGNFHLKQV